MSTSLSTTRIHCEYYVFFARASGPSSIFFGSQRVQAFISAKKKEFYQINLIVPWYKIEQVTKINKENQMTYIKQNT